MNDAISDPLIVRDGVVSLWGYGVTIGVSRGHLVLNDGFADERRTLRLSKADRPQRITVIVESGGSVSFDAIRWITNPIRRRSCFSRAAGPCSPRSGRVVSMIRSSDVPSR